MTPELKTACEVIFQEHKVSSQIKWNRDVFRGRIPVGLSEMAKVTLVTKNILLLPNKSKKIVTLLNPDVAAASSFEEAEAMMGNKEAPALAGVMAYDHTAFAEDYLQDFDSLLPEYSHSLPADAPATEMPAMTIKIKWYLKPLFYYVVWPLCAAVAGLLITYLIALAQKEFFLTGN